ncbi:MerR family transcriptional regulator [Desertibacillus haloalkaliphilus]|uniref:MerR family transcriptional regulator n=1 Tax=Desertibacillus haloalkaliphilus TaxID=1328930 RepID=UPI001C25B3C0|nr:MerR family transcriptional regulator [Desertibacillus haloalkaliphilus]MBU8905822.1 MerR family transcriptional regulator [Desertibacillus haloalkaliphilus]
MSQDLPRHIAIFPISVVQELTNLTARQIRYYEEQGLIKPARNQGNQRIFSLHDIERFIEIKGFIDRGVNIAGIKAMFESELQIENRLPADVKTSYVQVSDKTINEWMKILRQRLK